MRRLIGSEDCKTGFFVFQVRSGRGTLVSFIVTPTEVGSLDMKITAKSSVGQDVQVNEYAFNKCR